MRTTAMGERIKNIADFRNSVFLVSLLQCFTDILYELWVMPKYELITFYYSICMIRATTNIICNLALIQRSGYQ